MYINKNKTQYIVFQLQDGRYFTMIVEKEEHALMRAFTDIVDTTNRDFLQENANVDGQTPMGQMGKFASEGSKFYTNEYLLSQEARQAVEENYLHIHDLDFYSTGTTTCCQIPLGKLLARGFNTGHGAIRKPTSITSAMALASIIFQANQNMQHGGQSYPLFDYDLAPYVQKTFQRHKERLEHYPTTWTSMEIIEQAWKDTEKDVYQACEAFIHNCNSMHSRGGGQVPFVSINYGTDTSKEGRMITKNILLATQAGLGNGETPIFPIQIFKIKNGTNAEKNEPNYDLYELALQTTAKRLFPNFSFIDASMNQIHYDGTPESEVAYMGCRTRVMANRHGGETSIGRGNLSFTSINLVKIALTTGSFQAFLNKLEQYMDIAIRQLLARYSFQSKKHARHFPFLYLQHIWKDSETLEAHSKLDNVLKHGTLSVGFIGLAEALVALTGKHHGESHDAQQIGLQIIKWMRQKLERASNDYDVNFSLLATPAEGLSGKFTRNDQKQFGKLPGITDRDYYTNSFHVPVYFPIKAIDKIRKEGPYHALCNGGHISYIECDGDVSKNIPALNQLVKAMANANMGYASINHPVDQCLSCGYSGIIDQACPVCQNADEDYIERIRRITGYLVGDMSRWNAAKSSEERERIKHR